MQHFLRDNVYPQAHTSFSALTDGRSRGGSASTKSFDSEKKSDITNSNFHMEKNKSWQNIALCKCHLNIYFMNY